MSKERQSRIATRSNANGQFKTNEYGKSHPKSTTREHLPLPGYGDVKPKRQ